MKTRNKTLIRAAELRREHPDWSRTEIARALITGGVEPGYAYRSARMIEGVQIEELPPKDTNSSKWVRCGNMEMLLS